MSLPSPALTYTSAAGASADYCASRGEYLNGLLLADYLGWRFLDSAEGVVRRVDTVARELIFVDKTVLAIDNILALAIL